MDFIKKNQLYLQAGVLAGIFGTALFQIHKQLKELSELDDQLHDLENKKFYSSQNKTLIETQQFKMAAVPKKGYYRKQSSTQEIYCICITGCDHSGKSAAITYIKDRLQNLERNVLIIPNADKITFKQDKDLMDRLTEEEKLSLLIKKMEIMRSLLIYNKKLAVHSSLTTIILCEGGMMDLLAENEKLIDGYKSEFEDRFEPIDTVRDKYYDAVIHVAWNQNTGTSEFFKANPEQLDDQLKIDKAIQKSWSAHSHYVIVDEPEFDLRMQSVLQSVQKIVGLQLTQNKWYKFQLERIKFPEEDTCGLEGYELEDTFLKTEDELSYEHVRTKVPLEGGSYQYFHYIKKLSSKNNISSVFRRYISAEEHYQLLKRKIATIDPLKRIRYCFIYLNQTMQIDIFEQINVGILRVSKPQKKNSNNEDIMLPDWIQIQKKINSDDSKYFAINIAKSLGVVKDKYW